MFLKVVLRKRRIHKRIKKLKINSKSHYPVTDKQVEILQQKQEPW